MSHAMPRKLPLKSSPPSSGSNQKFRVLMQATYKASHPLIPKGKKHPQTPPLHLHFQQSESFQVLSGSIGTTLGWDVQDTIWTPANTATPHEIAPWVPHSFWPDPDCTEDTTLLVWAHPDGGDEDMDRIFFGNLLRYMSDVHEKKASMDLLRMMRMQHETASALIMFPTATWLGPLRWSVPWGLQAALAAVARWTGVESVVEKYTESEDWEMLLKTKKKTL